MLTGDLAMPAESTNSDPRQNWPLYWFARLEKAVEVGDHQSAAEAQWELDRLGVHVAYGCPNAQRREAQPCSPR